jgi:ABC-type methionine transport system permease subunit
MLKWIAGFGITAWIISMLVGIAALVLTIKGLILAFSASILVGIIVLIVEPLPFIIGLVYMCNGTDLAQKILQLIS